MLVELLTQRACGKETSKSMVVVVSTENHWVLSKQVDGLECGYLEPVSPVMS
jgi:hypothetical protein